jgi:hypothetical protein
MIERQVLKVDARLPIMGGFGISLYFHFCNCEITELPVLISGNRFKEQNPFLSILMI